MPAVCCLAQASRHSGQMVAAHAKTFLFRGGTHIFPPAFQTLSQLSNSLVGCLALNQGHLSFQRPGVIYTIWHASSWREVPSLGWLSGRKSLFFPLQICFVLLEVSDLSFPAENLVGLRGQSCLRQPMSPKACWGSPCPRVQGRATAFEPCSCGREEVMVGMGTCRFLEVSADIDD